MEASFVRFATGEKIALHARGPEADFFLKLWRDPTERLEELEILLAEFKEFIYVDAEQRLEIPMEDVQPLLYIFTCGFKAKDCTLLQVACLFFLCYFEPTIKWFEKEMQEVTCFILKPYLNARFSRLFCSPLDFDGSQKYLQKWLESTLQPLAFNLHQLMWFECDLDVGDQLFLAEISNFSAITDSFLSQKTPLTIEEWDSLTLGTATESLGSLKARLMEEIKDFVVSRELNTNVLPTIYELPEFGAHFQNHPHSKEIHTLTFKVLRDLSALSSMRKDYPTHIKLRNEKKRAKAKEQEDEDIDPHLFPGAQVDEEEEEEEGEEEEEECGF